MVVGHVPRVMGARRESVASVAVPAYSEHFEQLRSGIEQKYAERIVELEESERYSHLMASTNSSAKSVSGRDRLGRLNEALTIIKSSPGMINDKNQRDFHRKMTMAVIRKLFKDDFAEHLEYLRTQFETDAFKAEVMIITPRRFGKTYSVAMFVAACAYAIEGSDQAIFSTGRRASKKLLDLIYRFLCKLPGMKESIIVKNVETIHIQGPNGPDDVRKISSYPSKVRLCSESVSWVSRARCLRYVTRCAHGIAVSLAQRSSAGPMVATGSRAVVRSLCAFRAWQRAPSTRQVRLRRQTRRTSGARR